MLNSCKRFVVNLSKSKHFQRKVSFRVEKGKIVVMSNSSSSESNKKDSFKRNAGIIIIGDEILKGHTKDLNASFLLSNLWTNGVTVRRVSFIPDNIEMIAHEVKMFSEKYSFVLTCGGIGPTHDDVTFEAIGKAFNEPLVLNKELEEKIKCLTDSSELNSTFLKMATLPVSTKLITGQDPITNTPVRYPLLNIKNVYVFPGVPEFMQKSFNINKHLFFSDNKFFLMKMYLSVHESVVAECLNKIDQSYEDVSIGSYPILNDVYKVKITLEAEQESILDSAFNALVKELPSQIIISVKKCQPNSRDEHHEIFNTTEKNLQRKRISSSTNLTSLSVVDLQHFLDAKNTSMLGSALKTAWAVLNQTVSMYQLDEICIGFNGGKDCTVALHLYVAFVKKYFPDSCQKITGLYLKNANPFQEAQDFIKDCEANYNLDMIIIPSTIKEGLENLKETHPKIKAVIMGTRRHDPYSSQLRSFSMTDVSWPEFMRVFPILDWSYSEVWQFLRTFDLPYCKLYDDGYTSLGDPKNTFKNKSLLQSDGRYSPAYLLTEETLEREGRDTSGNAISMETRE